MTLREELRQKVQDARRRKLREEEEKVVRERELDVLKNYEDVKRARDLLPITLDMIRNDAALGHESHDIHDGNERMLRYLRELLIERDLDCTEMRKNVGNVRYSDDTPEVEITEYAFTVSWGN